MNSGDLRAFAALRLELTEERARLIARVKEIDDALGVQPEATKQRTETLAPELSPLERKALDLVRASSGMPVGWYAARLVGPDLYKNTMSARSALWRLEKQGLVRCDGARAQRRVHIA